VEALQVADGRCGIAANMVYVQVFATSVVGEPAVPDPAALVRPEFGSRNVPCLALFDHCFRSRAWSARHT
jgi:hypothetical protein